MPSVLEPRWLGRRVSIRRVLDLPAAGRVRFGDVVGDLIGLDAQTAVVETRNGPVEVALDRVALAKLVAPSTADELAVEAVAARGLRPAHTAELGGWLLRAHAGFTRRANSVLPLRAPGMPLDDALPLARAWYAERGLPLRFHLPVEARRLLDAELAERGWRAGPPTHVFVARLDALRGRTAQAAPVDLARTPPVELARTPDDAWFARYRGGEGRSEPARSLLTNHDDVMFASVRLDGQTAAVGRGAVDDGWLGVMAVEVHPAYRRQGLATAVIAELTRWGAASGAVRSYLQVYSDNTAAVSLYENLGYWVHHQYHNRTEPEGFSA